MALVTGVVGQVRWHHYHAAAINGYSVMRSPEGQWSLRATVVLSDAFKLSQRPLTFVAPTTQGDLCWPITSLEVSNGALTAQLGPPRES